MIVVRVWGGLGNQLFQYAFGYALSRELGQELVLDNSFYSDGSQSGRQYKRNYKLDLLNLDNHLVTNKKELPKTIAFLQNKVVNKFIRVFPKYYTPCGSDYHYLKETKRYYYDFVWKLQFLHLYADGYWQTEKYFEKYYEEIRQQFTPNYSQDDVVSKLMGQMGSEKSVAVHIRRTDYVKLSKTHPNRCYADKDYYLRAIALIREQVANPIFYFFSDDVDWVKNNFAGAGYHLVSLHTQNADLDEMMCMSACRYNIIAASTFSWWGAWLKKHDGLVIAPKGYFNNHDIIPDKWVVL